MTGRSPRPSDLELHATGRELLLTDHCLHFVSASVVRASALRGALERVHTRNEWAPHIWFGVAAATGPCAVLPREGVVGGLESGWLPRRVTLLTREIVGTFDAGFHHVLDEADFARMLDIRFACEQGNDDHWMAAPLADLLDAVTRFPASVQLRRLTARRAIAECDRTAMAAAARAAAVSGAAEEAARLVAEGEERFAVADLAGALARIETALAVHPIFASGWSSLGVVRDALRRPDAGQAFDTALVIEPGCVEALANRALWHAARGHRQLAERDAEQLAVLSPQAAMTAVVGEVVRGL